MKVKFYNIEGRVIAGTWSAIEFKQITRANFCELTPKQVAEYILIVNSKL